MSTSESAMDYPEEIPKKDASPPVPRPYFRLGSRIRDLRTKKDLSQRDLARAVRVSDSYFAHVEKGHYRPNERVLSRIANILDTTYEDLAVLAGYVQSPATGAIVQTTPEKKPVLTRIGSFPKSSLDMVEQFLLSLYFTPKDEVDELRATLARYRGTFLDPSLDPGTQDDVLDILSGEGDATTRSDPDNQAKEKDKDMPDDKAM